jgi:outer membrane protein assembly factor BamB
MQKMWVKKKSVFSLVLICCLLLCTTTALSDSWPMFLHDTAHSGFSFSSAPTTNNVLWSYMTQNSIRSSPVLSNGNVYVGSDDGRLYCLDASNGTLLWNYTTTKQMSSTPTVSNGKVYVGSYDGNVYCIDAFNGSMRWEFQTNGIVKASPTVSNGRVYVGSYSGNLYCLDANNGSELWTYPMGMVYSSAAVVDGKVYIGSTMSYVFCLDATTGEKNWQYHTTGAVFSSPAIAYGNVYVGSDDHNLHCLNMQNGSKRWNFTTRDVIWSSPAVAYGKVFIGSSDTVLYCLDGTTGSLVWNYTTGGSLLSSPAIVDGRVYVGSMDRNIYCLNEENGNLIWSYRTGGGIDWSSCAISDGKIYVGSDDHTLYCFRDNSPPATPNKPQGATLGVIGQEYGYITGNVLDPENDFVSYQFDWNASGSHEFSSWVDMPNMRHAWNSMGTYHVSVRAQDRYHLLSSWSEPLSVTITNQSQETLVITVDPSVVPEGTNFTVTVTAQDKAVDHAQVSFLSGVYLTDSNGMVRLSAPFVNQNTESILTATHEGYTTAMMTIHILDEKETTLQGWIFGIVYNDSGHTIQGALVSALNEETAIKYSTTTDAEGRFVKAVPPGSYTIQATCDGYKPAIIQHIGIQNKKATEVNFNLETQENHVPQTNPELTNAIKNGSIDANILIQQSNSEIELFSDINVTTPEVNSTAKTISFLVGKENHKPMVLLLTFDTNSVIDFVKKFTVTIDGNPIEQSATLSDLLHANNSSGYTLVETADPNITYIVISIPHSSQHLITISQIVEVLTGPIALTIYLVVGVVVLLFFISYNFKETISFKLFYKRRR